MGRNVLIEEASIQHFLQVYSGVSSTSEFQIGVLVGKLSEAKDYLLGIFPTPIQGEESGSSGGDGEKKKLFHTSWNIDKFWVAEHANQVTRMLPGGIDVIGLFFFCTPESFKQYEILAVQCLMEIYKTQNEASINTADLLKIPTAERLLLHICSKTKKLNCKSYDLSTNQAKTRPSEIKVQKDLTSQFHTVSSSFSFQLNTWLTENSTPKADIQKSISNLSSSVQHIIGFVDGKVYSSSSQSEDETGALTIEKLLSKKQQNSFKVELYEPYSIVQNVPTQSKGHVILSGAISVRAYVTMKDSVFKILEVLKKDVIRSIQSRFELLCEDLDNSETNLFSSSQPKDAQSEFNFPKRIYFPWIGKLALCDYLLPNEKNEDCAERLTALLSLPISTNFENSIESFESFSKLQEKNVTQIGTQSQQSTKESKKSESNNDNNNPANKNHNVSLIVAASVVIVACIAYYISFAT